jgi:transcription initiation factor TFIIH subunit 1
MLEDRVEVMLPPYLVHVLSHPEQTGNEKDVTMQAGRQRGALPLIRKFNEHSERLLNFTLSVPSFHNINTDADKLDV